MSDGAYGALLSINPYLCISLNSMNKLRFLSLGSGSSGNCYYFGNLSRGILIDAGISAKTVRRNLRLIGVDFSQILGVFVSHDHVDHIKSIGTFGETFQIPVFATQKIHDGIDRSWGVTQKLDRSKRFIDPGTDTQVGPFTLVSHLVSHDASESVCYQIKYMDHKILIATDLGTINEQLEMLIRQSDVVIIEANYDEKMLAEGTYPAYLKHRIASDKGHLCNDVTAGVLTANWHEGIKHVYLCHLSQDNNQPMIALNTIKQALLDAGIELDDSIKIEPLNRSLHELVEFDL
jgi:phosphoribosyl 1,2-cyclic phosphodiesterase